MKRLFLSLGLALAISGVAHAKTPPEVLTPYKAYRAALKSQDMQGAAKYAYEAWQKSEELLGDAKITGDLAHNYANLDIGRKKDVLKKQERAFKRAFELTDGYEDDAAAVYMERGIKFASFLMGASKTSRSFGVAKKVSKYAEDNNLTGSTFYGEALTIQAGYLATRGKNKQAEAISKKALAAFENREDRYVTAMPIMANLFQGYGLEGQKKSIEAALSYQKVMEALDGIHPDEHPLAAKALGRWSHMRMVLNSEGKLEEAEEKGLCQCWPYDKPRNESLKPIKRVPPIMPRNAYVSGFSIVQFDVDDSGAPINPEILVSWPKDLYEKPSLKALSEWEYTPRTPEETDTDRQDLVTTIRYHLSDQSGNIIY